MLHGSHYGQWPQNETSQGLFAGRWVLFCCLLGCPAGSAHQNSAQNLRLSMLGMKGFLSWVMCGVHSSVPFSPFKMPTFVFTNSLGATARPVAVVWWCLRVASMNQQEVCDLNPTQMCWAQAAPVLGLLCSTGGSEPINHCLPTAAAVVTELFRSRAEWDPHGWHLWLCGLHLPGDLKGWTINRCAKISLKYF